MLSHTEYTEEQEKDALCHLVKVSPWRTETAYFGKSIFDIQDAYQDFENKRTF